MLLVFFGYRVGEGFKVRVELRVRAGFRVRAGLRVWVGFRVRVGFRVKALQRIKRHKYALVKDVRNFLDFLQIPTRYNFIIDKI